MSNLPQNFSIDETMKLLTDRAQDPAAADQFFLKVYRRAQSYGRASQHQATFGGASVLHFSQPEAWLPGLMGGGDYELYAYDPADASKKIGGLMTHSFPGEIKMRPDYRAVESASWKGPRINIFPGVETATPAPIGGMQTPAMSASQAAQTQAQGVSVGANTAVVPDWVIREREERQREKQALEIQLERERTERKAAEEAAKLREERAKDKAEAEQKLRDLEARMAQQASVKPGPNMIETVVAIATAFAPIAKMFMDRSAEEARAAREAATAQAATTQAMLAKLGEPRGMPPEVTMLFEVMKSQAGAGGEMMSRMVEATSAFNGMAVTMIQTMADNLGGEQGNPIIDGVKDVVKALSTMQRGTAVGGARQAQQMMQTPQVLPASQPNYPNNPMQQNGQTPPAPQQPFNAAQPQHTAARATGPQTPAAHVHQFNGIPNMPVTPQDTTVAIEAMIRNHEPAPAVVDFILKRIDSKDAELFAALDQHNGDVEELLANRLGAWAIIPENSAYLNGLADAWREKADAAGIVEEAHEDDGIEDDIEDAVVSPAP